MNKGVSLVELLIATTIMIMILVPISTLLYLGYNDLYSENDSINAMQKGNDAMQNILKDLRMNDNKNLSVDNVLKNILTIKDPAIYTSSGIVYKYSSDLKTILKNDVSVFENGITVTDFSAYESNDGSLDSRLINIEFSIQYGKSGVKQFKNSFRRNNY